MKSCSRSWHRAENASTSLSSLPPALPSPTTPPSLSCARSLHIPLFNLTAVRFSCRSALCVGRLTGKKLTSRPQYPSIALVASSTRRIASPFLLSDRFEKKKRKKKKSIRNTSGTFNLVVGLLCCLDPTRPSLSSSIQYPQSPYF